MCPKCYFGRYKLSPVEWSDLLREHLKSYPVRWTGDGLEQLVYTFEPKSIRRGEYFLKDGQVSRHLALVVRGCLRLYVLDDGEDRSVFFFPEKYFCADSRSFLTGKPARCFIQAIEDCELLTLSFEKIHQLTTAHSDVAECSRIVTEKLLLSAENRVMLLLRSNPESRYKFMLEEFGGLVNRIPQKYLASYLGITPVSLSRIRNRLAHSA
jgi:CRP-like cAMP-binding protein